ncbi:MAG: heme NO-binding domain-containing protein [Chitinophagaceae bacterium]
MYGIVNKAIEELVIANFGEEKWEAIKAKSDIDIEYFISNEPYDDEITFKLAGAVSNEMNISVADVLITFGEWWILKTAKEKYGSLLSTGGESLRAFLIHLPDFHTRIMLMYPKLTPPEFKISHIEDNSVQVHYFSKREGLQEFVRGLLQGLSKLYQTQTSIELLQTRNEGSSHEIFKVTWI